MSWKSIETGLQVQGTSNLSLELWPWCGPIFHLIGLIIGMIHISDFEK